MPRKSYQDNYTGRKKRSNENGEEQLATTSNEIDNENCVSKKPRISKDGISINRPRMLYQFSHTFSKNARVKEVFFIQQTNFNHSQE